jgi:hypothetical protein
VPCPRWACPQFGVTFEPRQERRWAWQEVNCEGISVNEAVHTSVIESTVGRRRLCEVDVRWCYFAHTGNEVSSCVCRGVRFGLKWDYL